ncbi:MAG: CHAT domain-containing protein [Cytophagales bacterium]|nr:MAG: CHAT domain-containing protein [Cytophagales bacterium]TAF60046.1 MAG: CHAT domain-containing protein [Cytophagales bacterium]
MKKIVFWILLLCGASDAVWAQDKAAALEQAFIFSERAKSHVFLSQLNFFKDSEHIVGVPDSILAQENSLQNNIIRLERLIADYKTGSDSSNRKVYEQKLLTQKTLQERLELQIKKTYPRYYDLRYGSAVPTIANIMKSLPPNTAIVSYFVGQDALFTFVIDPENNLRVFRSEPKQPITLQVQNFNKTIMGQDKSNFISASQQLFQELFAFTLPKSIKNLILVPDIGLANLPFEALLTEPASASSNYEALPYLLKKYNVMYSTSASAYCQSLAESWNSAYKTDFVGVVPSFENPAYSTVSKDVLAFFEDLQVRDSTAYKSVLLGRDIRPLRHTLQELSSIKKIMEKTTLTTRFVEKQDANEMCIKLGAINEARVVHLAAHTFINQEKPWLSGILMAQDSTSNQDGLLHIHEILNTKLSAELLMLTATHGGVGAARTGEGCLGMARAWFYAGAQRLGLSLWLNETVANEQLLSDFYTTLSTPSKKAIDYSTSLRKSKLKLIKSKEYSAPYFWSHLIMFGR